MNLDATNTFSGGILLNSGTLVLGAAGATGSGPITFGTDPLLEFAYCDTPGNVINDFAAGSTIEITGFAESSDSYGSPYLLLASVTGTFPPLLETVELDIPGLGTSDLELSTMTADGMRLDRTSRHIARAKDDHFLIVLQNAGLMHAEQDCKIRRQRPGFVIPSRHGHRCRNPAG